MNPARAAVHGRDSPADKVAPIGARPAPGCAASCLSCADARGVAGDGAARLAPSTQHPLAVERSAARCQAVLTAGIGPTWPANMARHPACAAGTAAAISAAASAHARSQRARRKNAVAIEAEFTNIRLGA